MAPPSPSPVVMRQERLPLQGPHMDFDRFQSFCRDLIQYLPAIGDIIELRHHGVSGDAQEGIDLFCRTRDGRTIGIQCKQVKNFAAGQMREVMAAATYPASEFIVMLACEANAKVRKEIDGAANWRLFDLRDISRLVREEMPPPTAERLVRWHFGDSWCRDFLGRGSVAEHVMYQQTEQRRLGKLTRRSIVGILLLGSLMAFAIAYSSILATGHLPYWFVFYPIIPVSFGGAVGLVLLMLAKQVAMEDRIQCFGLVIEIGAQGAVYSSSISARCPLCDGQVEIETTPGRFGIKRLGFCQQNPDDHVFTFDRSMMDGTQLSPELLERLGRSRYERED